MKALFSPARRKAERNRPELAAHVRRCLARLNGLERDQAACTDEPSDAFGELMRGVIVHAPTLDAHEQPACGWMFYNLGRWIYLADAWDDRARDQKRGAYNAFIAAQADEEQAEFLLHVSLTEAQRGYDLVTMNGPHGLVDNILELGCRQRTQQLTRPPDEAAAGCAEITKENVE